MITRKRAASKDSNQPSSSGQQGSSSSLSPEHELMVNNNNNDLIKVSSQGNRRSSERVKKRRHTYEEQNPNNTIALNEIQIEPVCNLPQPQVDLNAQPNAPTPKTNTEPKPEPESAPKIICFASGSDRESHSKPKSMANSKGKSLLMPTNKDRSNESEHLKERQKQQAKKKRKELSEDVKACLGALSDLMPRSTIKSDAFISVLDSYTIDKNMPKPKVPKVKSRTKLRKQCTYCDEDFRVDKLYYHMLTKHYATKLKGTLLCFLCQKTFTDPQKFANHSLEGHPPFRECLCCSEEFPTQQIFIDHIEERLRNRRIWRCRFCAMLLYDADYLHRHLKYVHFISETKV